jgi:dihydroneopterin aldolase/2-amino-4-hydroxy-6-hydroxymethyldihydropteridine diphosphokinase/dihydropteroate synthase
LSALELVQNLKRIERSTGRTKTFTNGPRVIDLDLIFYGDEVVEIGKRGDTEGELGPGVGWLKVPHALVKEREFVLRPAVE